MHRVTGNPYVHHSASIFFLALLTLLLAVPRCMISAFAQEETGAETSEEASADQPSPAPAAPKHLQSARATMQTFLTSNHRKDFAAAAECLDFSSIDASPWQQEDYVVKLKDIIDRLERVDYQKISDDVVGKPYRFAPGATTQPIVISCGNDKIWRFTAETVAAIDELSAEVNERPLIVTSTPWYRRMTPLDNEVWRIVAMFVSILLGFMLGRLAGILLNQIANLLDARQRHFFAVGFRSLARSASFALMVIGLKVGVQFLILNSIVHEISSTLVNISLTAVVAYVSYCLVDVVDAWLTTISTRTLTKMDDMLVPMVRTSLRVTILILLLVQCATILSDKPITSIIAGLGVGGLAIGLAAQDTIKNFFGSMMIFSDRPFDLGDRIVVNGHDGPVESVGFRSTRIRTLEGHLVTIPNGELANQTILNVGKRPSIRRILNLGVTYDTPPDKLQRAVQIVKDVLDGHEGMDPELPPRVFFNDFTESSLNIFAIYWYHPPEYWKYCEFGQQLNFEILTRFNDEGIEFAFPSQTLYLAGDSNRPLTGLTT